jgi:cyclic beta-1,2-glucan synthetase
MNLYSFERAHSNGAGTNASIGARLGAILHEPIARLFRSGGPVPLRIADDPIRSELFSIERLELHAESLAAAQQINAKPAADLRLERRLRDNERALRRAYHATIVAVREKRAITPAADWLVDNFHVLEEQVREIRVDLPPGYHRQLPKLINGPFEGYPRVFGIAWAFVAHTDSHFDPDMLSRFVRAYQRVEPLSIGELWAVAITLRVVLVENLRRVAEGIVVNEAARQEANRLADRLLGVAGFEVESARTVLESLAKPLPTPLAAQLVQRLRDQDPKVLPAFAWLDERLAAQNSSAEAIVHDEQQRQGAMSVTIGNVITSMRLMSAIDWRELFEGVSLVDARLRADSNFAALDFATRDQYRRAIEVLARGSKHTELEIAEAALRAAGEAGAEDDPATARRRDPGYYLIAAGRPGFERSLGFHATLNARLARGNARLGISGYIALVTALTLLVILLMSQLVESDADPVRLLALALLGTIPASDAVIALINWLVASSFGPVALPSLSLEDGIPTSLRTMVVVPTLLTSREAITAQIERLEVHHLANEDGDLAFALLSDWTDSAAETEPGDAALLKAAADGIAALNRRYGPAPEGDRFLLLHRRRLWNAAQGMWIGWERKRGKLHELNRLLRGSLDTSFIPAGGQPPLVPGGVRYVIILDGDTRLPRGAAKRMVGKMAHPLNQPTLDPATGRVTDGYAILQPRVTPAMPSNREGSLFQRLFSATSGLDPYAAAASDFYQDMFGEGSYVGKGIYEVDRFEAALDGRIPENTLLSHDLLEGIFARAGLVSDIEVIDEFPARYDVAVARQSRWARGDWQLLPWILAWGGAIPPLGRWKMVDNLRRSLSAPAGLLGLVFGWGLPLPDAALWTAFILGAIAIPALLPFLIGIVPRGLRLSKRIHLRAVGTEGQLALSQVALQVSFLADHAWVMSDAILRTLYRLLVSRRNLLEWRTAAQAKLGPRLELSGFYRQMAGGTVLAGAAAIVTAWWAPGSWPVAAPIVLLWLAAPALARWVSLATAMSALPPVSAADARSLRLVARRTWHFFETFVTAEDHMLPPDNFQEDPVPVVAHRTSPTNLGLYLLTVVAARDFGWIGMTDAVERLEATLASMNTLERCRGHFYNWYGTLDRAALEPKYISSVDSGNLAGHLVALWNACAEMAHLPAIDPQWRSGIGDALGLMRGETGGGPALDAALDKFAASLGQPASTPEAIIARLNDLERCAETVRQLSEACGAEAVAWAESILAAIDSHRRDLDALMPWASLLAAEAASKARSDPAFIALLDGVPSLAGLPDLCDAAIAMLLSHRRTDAAELRDRDALIAAFERSARAAVAYAERLRAIGTLAHTLFDAMGFDFLFDTKRELLSIGYRVADGSLDPSCYDLLASEARLASFIAIARGDVPTRHWFRLGRAQVPVGFDSALISWSGSMFEYLMPSLVMHAPAGSLLEQTGRQVVRQQMKDGAGRGIPWGVSESAFNARDLELTYQYSSFGTPELALKRGMGDNAVVAPYATALAAMVDAAAAARNLKRLAELGGRGRYGWYEAVDFTKTRLPDGAKFAVVQAYMAHHQGMSVLAIADALLDGAMRRRFHAEPIIQATELLLQERVPRDVALAGPRTEGIAEAADDEPLSSTQRRFTSPHDATPRTHLLSNGSYAVMITAAGSGYSRWRELAVTRWHEDATTDRWGSYVFLRDLRSGAVWSAGYQPSGIEPDRYSVAFSEGRAEIIRQDGSLVTTLDVAVSSEDDAEVRRVSVTNLGSQSREIELTSYAEIVLAPPDADAAHPAFAKLFVETEFAADVGVLLARRRRRSPGDPQPWAAHLAVVEGETVGEIEFETDRARFLGRTRSIRAPVAMTAVTTLSNTVGAVLDPIFSLRRRVRVPPRSTVRVAFWTLIAPSRADALDLADKHHGALAFDRAMTLAWTQAQVQLRHLGIGAADAHLFQRLANYLLYASPGLRPTSEILKRGGGTAERLWAQGISGDLPIVLVRVGDDSDLPLVRQLLLAREYWQSKRLAVDLVILNERAISYLQDLQGALEALVRTSRSVPSVGEVSQGAVFILRTDLIVPELRDLLQTVARAVLIGHRGSLAEQIKTVREPKSPPLRPKRLPVTLPAPASRTSPALEFFNGLGGFAEDGSEYRTILRPGQMTPAPWLNVISNPSFGFQASVEGSGSTWSLNSQQNQLSPWSNDAVGDAPGEVFYLGDEETGGIWGPTALPIRVAGSVYDVRHGQGYSRFGHVAQGIALELLQYVPVDDPIKISRLTITNLSGRARRLTVTAYVEWVLGRSRGGSGRLIFTEIDAATRAMLASNPWNTEFAKRVAFADLAGRQSFWTGDRTEFLGRNGTLDRPAALCRPVPLSNRVGAGLDPCGALQTRLDLAVGQTVEIVFFLGEADGRDQAQALIGKYRSADLDAVLDAVGGLWDEVLDTVQVATPDRALDIMLNRWLLYQTLGCRIWARTGFYQASGAYGFRDQLQDSMALCVAKPALVREHLLRAASRQFVEGDMQHWWLPETGRGIRTRVSDDCLWLPYVASHYVEVTGDRGVLDEMVPFLEGPVLKPGEAEAFFQPMVSDRQASLFEHCALALDHSLALGSHGLPLMGTGDWNDGMNRVGDEGRGESIWLGWFLHATLTGFAELADAARAAAWRGHAEDLAQALERDGWDGDWYRRAYYDDGSPLGSATNEECRIDAIAQSWSVISGAGDPARAARAMAAVESELIRVDDGLALLFTPPFDQTPLDPGYVKGYPPGIRENGGQYTHAAFWSVIAFAKLGEGDKAAGLLSMLNPINHAATPEAVQRYRVEPYAVCADVYSTKPHVGRGGWTWYTGSAGWMYRAGLEWILGFRLQGSTLLLDPCIPKAWPRFGIVFRYHSTRYEIAVENPDGVSRGVLRAELDEAVLPGNEARVPLVDDGAAHRVRVILG